MGLKKWLVFLFMAATACQKGETENEVPGSGFEEIPQSRPLAPGILDEVSGISDSKTNPGFLWVQQDSGNPNELALLSHEGVFLKKIRIETAINRDWEDMLIANGPTTGTNYIYLADIGDNNLAYSQYQVYRFAEPTAATDIVPASDKINFQYPDGAHNAEAIIIDNSTNDIFIITKQDMPSRIYKLSYPQKTTSINTAVLTGFLSFSGVTGAAFSPDGKEVLIKTYEKIYSWEKKDGQTIEQALAQNPVAVTYQSEPQGEAICFKNDNSGFFTLSERPAVIAAVDLNFYKRK